MSMKKHICIFFIFIITSASQALSQNPAIGQYRLTVSFPKVVKYNGGGSWNDFNCEVKSNIEVITKSHIDEPRDGAVIPIVGATKLYDIGDLSTLHIWSQKKNNKITQDNHQSNYTLNFSNEYINQIVAVDDKNEAIFPFTDGIIQVIVIPDKIDIAYFGNDAGKQKLPSDERITLKATKGFSPKIYNWKYSIDGITWNDIPNGIISSNDKTEISFNGYELAGEDAFRSRLSQTISIGISYDNSDIPQWQYVLNPSLTAPKIVGVTYDTETCPNNGDAILHVTFDRQLVDANEVLYLKLNNRLSESINSDPILIDNNKHGIVSSLKSGTYDIEVVSTYMAYPSFTGSLGHSKLGFVINPRPAINFPTPTPTDATCYGGADGTITVTASREAGAKFTADLYERSSTKLVKSLDFNQGESQSFTDLRAQEYYVTIKDENDCSTAIQYVTVKEPQLAVGVDGEIAFQEPKGYNTKDGVFAFNIKGGRGNYAVQVVDAENNTNSSCSVVVTNNNCVVSGIGRGTYNIIITDGSYRPEFGNNCGCRHEFQYTVIAPPAIEPSITINKHVLCYSDNNGSATITAKGGRPYDPSIGTYDFAWYKKGETTPFFEEFKKTGSNYDLLTAGEYSVVVKDKNSIEATIEFTIKEPDPVLVNFVSNNIRCYKGSDGRVSVVASGGVEKYKAQVVGGEDYSKEIEFDIKTSAEFTGLAAGNYYLYLTDINGCPMRVNDDVTKTIEYYEIIIKEPKKPVQVELNDMQLPTSYDSKDGGFVVRVSGGTTQNGLYKISAKQADEGISITPTESAKDGVYVVYTFRGLKRGKYTIVAGDDNYTESTALPCGCGDNIDVEIVAPKQMKIGIKELKSVTCNGSSTAQAVAHAQGGVRFDGASMPYTYKWYKFGDKGRQVLGMENDSIARNLNAGRYQVEISDMKSVTIASDILTISEPDSLSVSFEIANIDCSGANTGSIKAIVKGGTAPYNYQWDINGQSGDKIQNLAMGMYSLMITDAKGCGKVAQAEVKSAVQITIDSIVVQPNCTNSNGGSIELALFGGSEPYSIMWADDNSTALKRENLKAGIYKVVITDNKGCRVPYEFKLKEPYSFTVSLPEDFMMCRNQSRTIQADCKERDVKYKWYCDGQEIQGNENSITASKAGVYGVVATNSVGCTAQDDIRVEVSTESLKLDMITPTRVAMGSEIHAVNLSTVTAEALVWNLPQEAIVLKRDDTEAVFILDKSGSYEVSLEGFKGNCSTIITRTVEVVDSGDGKLPDDAKSLIKQFLVTPNPTTGYFKVMVELNREDDFTMKLYSPDGVLVDEKSGIKVKDKTFEYEINGSIQGTYLLHLITQYDKAVLQVVVKNQ